jgi:hypothetical protein
MALTLTDGPENSIILVSTVNTDDGGSGVDVFNVTKISATYSISHDRSGTTQNTDRFYFHIIGDD